MKKRIAIGVLSIIIFWSMGEMICRLLNFPSYSTEEYFILNVCGELLGEYDPILFWS